MLAMFDVSGLTLLHWRKDWGLNKAEVEIPGNEKDCIRFDISKVLVWANKNQCTNLRYNLDSVVAWAKKNKPVKRSKPKRQRTTL